MIEFSGVILISIAELHLLRIVADFVLEYTFTYTIHSLDGHDTGAIVEYGMSRFKRGVAETDEPLAILTLVTFVEQETKMTLERRLRNTLNTSNAAYRGIIFEGFGAYLLARAFSAPRRLSDIFNFVGGKEVNEALQDGLAELVALERVGDNFQMTPLKIKTHYWLNHILGCSPSTVTNTLEWLQDPQGTAFCFPANIIGPDLIFVLRLTSDNTVLCMCVQFKHMEKMSPKDWRKAICTTNPSTFLSENTKDTNSPTCSNPSMQDRMVEAINNLGNETKKTEPCGLL